MSIKSNTRLRYGFRSLQAHKSKESNSKDGSQTKMIYKKPMTELNNYFLKKKNKHKETVLTAFLLIVDDTVDFASSLFNIVQLIRDAMLEIKQ